MGNIFNIKKFLGIVLCFSSDFTTLSTMAAGSKMGLIHTKICNHMGAENVHDVAVLKTELQRGHVVDTGNNNEYVRPATCPQIFTHMLSMRKFPYMVQG